MTSKDTSKHTSSQGSGDGPSLSGSQDGPTTAPSGPAPARVSLSRLRANKEEPTTSDISGPLFSHSSPSASLQRCLESKLRRRMAGLGSPLYALTWKRLDMPAGPQICALRASGHRMFGNVSFGWGTPTATLILEAKDPALDGRIRKMDSGRLRKSSKKGVEGSLNWSQAVLSSGFLPTPKLCGYCMGYPAEWGNCAPTATP